MSLKTQPDRPALAPAAPPDWGTLAEPGEPVASVRFECPDGTYSYPYHTLARWVLRPGARESLEIQAGPDRILAEGRDLAVIRDALDSGRLRSLRVMPERYATTKVGTYVFVLRVIGP